MTHQTVERKAFNVYIPANVYDGRYYDHRTVSVKVFIENGIYTPADAIHWINTNKERVLDHINKLTYSKGRRLVPKDVESNVFFKPTYTVSGPITVHSYIPL